MPVNRIEIFFSQAHSFKIAEENSRDDIIREAWKNTRATIIDFCEIIHI